MIKNKFLKNVLMCTLAVSLLAAPVVGANAVSGNTTNPGSGSGGPIKENNGGGGGGTNAPAPAPVATTSSVKLADGTKIVTTVDGQYSASNVAGVAVTTPKADMSAALGLAKGEKAYAKVYKSSYGKLAKASVDTAAAAMNVPVGPVLDINVGKLSAQGKFSAVKNTATPVSFAVGIPSSFATAGYDYAVIRVQAGGATAVLPDTDSNPNTVTFNTSGFGVFALVKAPAGSFAALR